MDFDYRLGGQRYHQVMPLQSFTFENDIIRLVVEHRRVNQTTHTVTVILRISITGFGWVHLPLFTQVARAEDEVESDSESDSELYAFVEVYYPDGEEISVCQGRTRDGGDHWDEEVL